MGPSMTSKCQKRKHVFLLSQAERKISPEVLFPFTSHWLQSQDVSILKLVTTGVVAWLCLAYINTDSVPWNWGEILSPWGAMVFTSWGPVGKFEKVGYGTCCGVDNHSRPRRARTPKHWLNWSTRWFSQLAEEISSNTRCSMWTTSLMIWCSSEIRTNVRNVQHAFQGRHPTPLPAVCEGHCPTFPGPSSPCCGPWPIPCLIPSAWRGENLELGKWASLLPFLPSFYTIILKNYVVLSISLLFATFLFWCWILLFLYHQASGNPPIPMRRLLLVITTCNSLWLLLTSMWYGVEGREVVVSSLGWPCLPCLPHRIVLRMKWEILYDYVLLDHAINPHSGGAALERWNQTWHSR